MESPQYYRTVTPIWLHPYFLIFLFQIFNNNHALLSWYSLSIPPTLRIGRWPQSTSHCSEVGAVMCQPTFFCLASRSDKKGKKEKRREKKTLQSTRSKCSLPGPWWLLSLLVGCLVSSAQSHISRWDPHAPDWGGDERLWENVPFFLPKPS